MLPYSLQTVIPSAFQAALYYCVLVINMLNDAAPKVDASGDESLTYFCE